MKEKIDNYLNHDIDPWPHTKMSHHDIQIYPEMDENIIPTHNYICSKSMINRLTESIEKCNNVIKHMTMSVPEPEICPVCLVEFEDTNYVIPPCKHKICAICFTHNIKHNKHTGDCCVLCRKRIC